MAIISVSNLSKSFGNRDLFLDIGFSVDDRERVALIGPNGCGKTTILKILAGQVELDSGAVHRIQGLSIGYLAQDVESDSQVLLLHYTVGITPELLECAERLYNIEQGNLHNAGDADYATEYADLTHKFEDIGGFELQAGAMTILAGLGFDESDLYKPVQLLSGGQKVRAALSRLLLESPLLLLLDEPTNHLDIQVCEWLQDYIANRYQGTALIVSHDRYFLDRVVTRVIEMDNGVIVSWPGAYTAYAAAKEARLEEQRKLYKTQQKEIARIEEAIQTLFSHRKFTRRDSKVKQLEKIQRVKVSGPQKSISAGFKAADRSGAMVLKLDELSKGFGEKKLFDSVDYVMDRGKKVGVVGPNGSGKTTLLKIIAGLENPDSGHVEIGHKVSFVYFAQEFAGLTPDNSVIDELLSDSEITAQQARDLLAQFLFMGDDAFKPVHVLSGGEKCRLALAKAIAGAPNLLILDEPTNHLDIASRETLENALLEFNGSVITASHDRYLLDRVTNEIVEIADGKFVKYLGNYTEYRSKKAGEDTPVDLPMLDKRGKQIAPPPPKRPMSTLRELEKQAREIGKRIEEIEQDIHKTETRQAFLTEALANEETYRDGSAKELSAEYNSLDIHLKELYSEWETLGETHAEMESEIAEIPGNKT